MPSLIIGQNISPFFKKKLVYGEVSSKQLRENFKHDAIYKKVAVRATDKRIQKYRFITNLSKTLSFKTVRRATGNSKQNLDRIKLSL